MDDGFWLWVLGERATPGDAGQAFEVFRKPSTFGSDSFD
jgi:hypothetical protein